jgi:hypothetical protein
VRDCPEVVQDLSMNETAAQTYARLRLFLLKGRRDGSLTEESEDKLLDEMDGVWWAMSVAERAESERTLPEARRQIEVALASRGAAHAQLARKVAELQSESPPPKHSNYVSREALDALRPRRALELQS